MRLAGLAGLAGPAGQAAGAYGGPGQLWNEDYYQLGLDIFGRDWSWDAMKLDDDVGQFSEWSRE
jgi:hypothetical protein